MSTKQKRCPICKENRISVNRVICRECADKEDLEAEGFGASNGTGGATCEYFTKEHLDGSTYDRGALETTEATVTNIREAFARLMDALHVARVLSKEEIENIVRGY